MEKVVNGVRYLFEDPDYGEIVDEMLHGRINIYEIIMSKVWKFIDKYKITMRLDFLNLDNSDLIMSYTVTIFSEGYRKNDWHKQGRITFNIHRKRNMYICKIIDIYSDEKGLGGILFHILVQLTKRIANELNTDSLCICGNLSSIDKDKHWIDSIPFYCMQAYNYEYQLILKTDSSQGYSFKKIDGTHDDRYQLALEFAKEYIAHSNFGSFTFVPE